MVNNPTHIIWHHTGVASVRPQFAAVDAAHKRRGFPRSALGYHGGYHVLIERNGDARRYRADPEIGAHTIGHNASSIGIALAGNLTQKKPTVQQAIAFARLLRATMRRWNISSVDIQPHRNYKNTQCPGLMLPDEWPAMILGLTIVEPCP